MMSPIESDDVAPGIPFAMAEGDAVELLGGLAVPTIVCANDPPWTAMSEHAREQTGWTPTLVVTAYDMEVAHLSSTVDAATTHLGIDVVEECTVIGVGGGTALDTAKYVAWSLDRPLVQIPTITSVDAGFTDAVGVRDAGRVRYVGQIVPELVLLDVALVRDAPPQLNRAGIGDVLSCHTGMFDWRLATDAGHGPRWDDRLAALATTLLDELEEAVDDVAAVSEAGVRFLAGAYRRIGAACRAAGHSRFEEGSEHFWAYAYEHRTGAHPVHGEIIAFAVCALAHVQGNDPDRPRRIVERSGVRVHPTDLGIDRATFEAVLSELAEYARAEDLDVGVVDLRPVTAGQVDAAWNFVSTLPRVAHTGDVR